MGVKAYIILRKDNPRIPHSLRSLTGPYLFRTEAEQYAAVITAATSDLCQLSIIQIERILCEAVRFNSRWVVTAVWNIRSLSIGFEGEVIIDGTLYKAVRDQPGEPWHVIEQAAKAVN